MQRAGLRLNQTHIKQPGSSTRLIVDSRIAISQTKHPACNNREAAAADSAKLLDHALMKHELRGDPGFPRMGRRAV